MFSGALLAGVGELLNSTNDHGHLAICTQDSTPVKYEAAKGRIGILF